MQAQDLEVAQQTGEPGVAPSWHRHDEFQGPETATTASLRTKRKRSVLQEKLPLQRGKLSNPGGPLGHWPAGTAQPLPQASATLQSWHF
jgi:hypothetical protein